MSEKEHYDCKHFQIFDDGVTSDYYCHRKKEWFWIVEETPVCEFYDDGG